MASASEDADFTSDDNTLAVNENTEDIAVNNSDVNQANENSEDILGDPANIVTPENINEFVDADSKAIIYDGEELIFQGEFNSSVINGINVVAPIKLIGNEATMKNVSFNVLSSNVIIKGFTFIQDNYDVSQITIIDSENVEISDVDITFTANSEYGGYAIQADHASKLNLTNNEITFIGNSTAMLSSNAIYIVNSDDPVIKKNRFYLNLTSCTIPWLETPAGSGNYVGFPVSVGVVVDSSNGVTFEGNVINVDYNDIVEGYYGGDDSIYVIQFKNSDDATIFDNEINALGHNYIYGLVISGQNFNVSTNRFNVGSDINYANGIDVEGPATGVVENNNFTIKSISSAYPIYAAMSNGDVSVDYIGNNINANAYFVCAIELGGIKSIVKDNTIIMDGNHTIGVGSKVSELTIQNNNITSFASNEGNMYIWDGIGVETAGIKIAEGNVIIKDNNISTLGKGISIQGNQITVSGNNLTVSGNNMATYGIYAVEVSDLKINDNNLNYNATTLGTAINNAIYISSSNNAVINKNRFYLNLTSCTIPWLETPAGSGNYVGFPVSVGVVVDSSNGVTFEGNVINVDYNDIVEGYYGSDDSIYVIQFKNSDDATIFDNEINALGHNYIYGLVISGQNFNVSTNRFNVSSDINYANGIDVEGPATGIIENNKISANSVETAYPIYGAMSNGDVIVDINNNEINGSAYLVYGIQMGGKSVSVENNNITIKGNHTIGIGVHVNQVTINKNKIISDASNEGDKYVWDDMGTTSEGILIKSGESVITNNIVETTANKAINLGNNTALIKGNDLTANNTSGKDAIESTGYVNELVESTNLKTILVGSDLTKIYGDKDQYILKVLDENGKPLVGKTITAIIGGKPLEANTDENGIAKFDIDLVAGNYIIDVSFAGTVVYGAKTTSNTITVNAKPTAITAPNTSVLVTVAKKGYAYKITLKDNSGNILAGQKITINGKEYTTGKAGVVSYKLSASKEGSQKLTVKFAGDDRYAASTATATVKFTKEATKITAKKATLKAKKSKKYTVVLKDSKGKGIKGVKVSIKVGKKTYSATTKANGKATFNLKKLTKKGTYKAQVTFKTTSLYKASSAKVTIKVKK